MKRCAHCKRKGHLRESCFLWLDTPDGSKWAAKNPEKAAKTRKLQMKLGKSSNKNAISSHISKRNSVYHDNDDQSGAWVLEESALISSTTKKSSDIELDTEATNHIFHDKFLFVSISPTNKSVATASGESVPVWNRKSTVQNF